MNIWVRAMRNEDLDEVAALEARSHSHPWSIRVFQRELANPLSRIDLLFVQTSLAGYLCSWLVADELEIQNVVIDSGFRRRGLARHLIEESIRRANESGAVRALLEVRAGNLPALELYRSLGFVECGLRRSYYPDGEDAVLMSRDMF